MGTTSDRESGRGLSINFEAVATEGKGVFETLRVICRMVLDKVTKDLS